MCNPNFVLTYSENTDAGEPTSTVNNRFFCKKENAQAAMEAAFQKVDAIMGFTQRKTDDEHYISRTEDSIYVCDGMDSMFWTIAEIKAEDTASPLEAPMPLKAAKEMQEKEGRVHGLVKASLMELILNDIDEVDDILVSRLVEGGIPYMVDLKFAPVGTISDTLHKPDALSEVIVEVTGQLDWT